MGRAPNLVVGMGNPILCDDAVGVRLASSIAKSLGGRADVDVIEECSVGGLNLIDVLAGYRRAFVLDSIKTTGGRPGDWYHFTAERLRDTMNLACVHDANFATALELGRRLGHDLPESSDVHVFAVEVSDNTTFSETMSPPLEAAFPRYSSEIRAEVETLLGP